MPAQTILAASSSAETLPDYRSRHTDLPCTESGNKHVIVFQDMFTKWPMVFPVSDQKSVRIARLLCEEIVPLFGVPEVLLSDRGTNLLSHFMLDVCTLLDITMLNTTACHPECDGMIEHFNRTLKTILHKRVSQFGAQWVSGVLWAYRNTPHDSTGEKTLISALWMGLQVSPDTICDPCWGGLGLGPRLPWRLLYCQQN